MPPKKVIFTEMKTDDKDTAEQQEKPMTEQYYIEAMEQLKNKFNEVEYLKVKINMQNIDLKKELCAAYGCIKVLDNLIHNSYDIEGDIVTMCESLRAHLSAVIEDII